MFPKIHKPENPGRPVISYSNCHTTSISQYVHCHRQPHIKELKSFVKDSLNFVKRTNNLGNIPENNILVSLDVRSLYTNFPHKEGINAVETTLKHIIASITGILNTFKHILRVIIENLRAKILFAVHSVYFRPEEHYSVLIF